MVEEKQVFICGGPRCDPTRRNADVLVHHLRQQAESDPGLNLQVARRLCMSACEHGPTLHIQPDGTWYRCPDIETLTRIIQGPLRKGEAISDIQFQNN